VLAVNGTPVSSAEDLRLMISEMPPGTQITLKIVRRMARRSICRSCWRRCGKAERVAGGRDGAPLTDEDRRKLGLTVRGLNGLLISAVDDGSPYADSLAPEMVIMEINRTPVSDLAAAKALLKAGHRSLLFIYFPREPALRSLR